MPNPNLSGQHTSGLIQTGVPLDFSVSKLELVNPGTTRASPKSAKHARRCLLIKMFCWNRELGEPDDSEAIRADNCTPLRSPCTTCCECKYFNPVVMSFNYTNGWERMSFNRTGEAQVKIHQFESVRVLILPYERIDGSIFHEFRDNLILPGPLHGLHLCTNKWKEVRVAQVFPSDHLLEKYLHEMRANVNALLSLHRDCMTDPCNLFLPGTVVALIDRQHFYSNFLGVVASDPNTRISTSANLRLRLVA